MAITVSRTDSVNVNLGISENKSLNTQSKTAVPSLSNSDNFAVSSSANNRFDGNSSIQIILSGKKSLALGSKGEDVKLIQSALADMGFYIGTSADGKYGNQTITAVKNFQSSRNLPQTGIVDKNTMDELIKVAPPKESTLWTKGIVNSIKERNVENVIPSNELEKGKRATIVVDLSEHRLFLYNKDNSLNKVYSVASGKDGHADGRGGKTQAGIKKVTGKNDDPSKRANELWPETKGKAFGTKLMDLSWYDINSKKTRSSGEELHGTFSDNSIGTDASHGCMRLLNKDVEEIFGQIKVGDLVKVQE